MIGKAISAVLMGNSNITNIVGNRLFPIAEYGKGLPAMYYIVKMLPQYVKNGPTMIKWQFTILTHCTTYNQSWELAFKTKQLFDKQNQKTNAGIKFTTIRCLSITDDYEFTVNNYGHTVQFEVTTPNIKVTFD